MVDFNKEATIGTPAHNVVKILLLQARANVLEALEDYNKKMCKGIEADQSILKSRLLTWFLEHQAYLDRNLKKKDWVQMQNRAKESLFFNQDELKPEKIWEFIKDLNKIIDKLKVTRVDTRVSYDRSNVELDNEMNELF